VLALTLLLRASGIPARYATGYAIVEYSQLEEAIVVRARHAHAWTRAWLNGRWIDLDPTPPDWLGLETERLAPAWAWIADVLRRASYRWEQREEVQAGDAWWGGAGGTGGDPGLAASQGEARGAGGPGAGSVAARAPAYLDWVVAEHYDVVGLTVTMRTYQRHAVRVRPGGQLVRQMLKVFPLPNAASDRHPHTSNRYPARPATLADAPREPSRNCTARRHSACATRCGGVPA
jgi:hypothetical protein